MVPVVDALRFRSEVGDWQARREIGKFEKYIDCSLTAPMHTLGPHPDATPNAVNPAARIVQ